MEAESVSARQSDQRSLRQGSDNQGLPDGNDQPGDKSTQRQDDPLGRVWANIAADISKAMEKSPQHHKTGYGRQNECEEMDILGLVEARLTQALERRLSRDHQGQKTPSGNERHATDEHRDLQPETERRDRAESEKRPQLPPTDDRANTEMKPLPQGEIERRDRAEQQERERKPQLPRIDLTDDLANMEVKHFRPTGNPAADGQALFQTIENLRPGTALRVHAGNYQLPARNLRIGGTEGRPIKIIGDGDATHIFGGTPDATCRITGSSNFALENLNFHESKVGYKLWVTDSSNVEVANCSFTADPRRLDGSNPIHFGGRNKNVSIHNNFIDVTQGPRSSHGIYIGSGYSEKVDIIDNEIHHFGPGCAAMIQFNNTDDHPDPRRIAQTGHKNISVTGNRLIAESLTCRNGQTLETRDQGGGGMALAGVNGALISNNIMDLTRGAMVEVWGNGAVGTRIENNVFHYRGEPGRGVVRKSVNVGVEFQNNTPDLPAEGQTATGAAFSSRARDSRQRPDDDRPTHGGHPATTERAAKKAGVEKPVITDDQHDLPEGQSTGAGAELLRLADQSGLYSVTRKYMDAFEQRRGVLARSGRKAPSTDQIENTYKNLTELIHENPNAALGLADRRKIFVDAMHNLANPLAIDQGRNDTCNVATIEEFLATRYPDRYSKICADVAIRDSFSTVTGEVHRFPPSGLRPGAEEQESDPDKAHTNHQRNWASKILQLSGANVPHKWRDSYTAGDPKMNVPGILSVCESLCGEQMPYIGFDRTSDAWRASRVTADEILRLKAEGNLPCGVVTLWGNHVQTIHDARRNSAGSVDVYLDDQHGAAGDWGWCSLSELHRRQFPQTKTR